MNAKSAKTGNSGPKVRSDCEILLELTEGGGLVIDLNSKVKVLYGESIMSQCREILRFFGIENAFLSINDSGALPFVISARLEAAVKQIKPTDKEYLPVINEGNETPAKRERCRFSRLYIPGNTPSMMINAGLHSADGIILDLEDSVAYEKKDEARILVRNALRQIDFKGAERMVRINQGERGLKDLDYVIPHHVNLVLIPKCESTDHIKAVESRIKEIQVSKGINGPVYILPIIESALGVESAFEIARSSPDIVALAVGLEDLSSDLGVARTKEGAETFYARSRIINAAKAAGVQPVDSVFSDTDDMEALYYYVQSSKSLGFEGMGCIHPRQIPVVIKGFSPTEEEIEKSKKIIVAFNQARLGGLGVVSLGTKMIDAPVVTKAQKVIDLAISLGLLSETWMDAEKSD